MLDLAGLCEQVGVEIYDAELLSENGRKIYRVSIAKKGGVSLDECAKLSEILSPILDVEPPCASAYSLEVSSAGLERNLKSLNHYKLSLGEKVIITLNDKSKVRGEILAVNNENIDILNESGEKISLNFNDIKKAKTFVEWDLG